MMRALGAVVLTACLGACWGADEPGKTYFDRQVAPVLINRCTVSGGGPCHVADANGRAMGNLDLSSFETVTRRRDVLERFGSYPMPLLLLKAMGPNFDQTMVIGDVPDVPLFIRHSGGVLIQYGDEAFWALQQWLENGATENGMPPLPPSGGDRGPCSPDIRTDLFAQPTLDAVDVDSPEYEMFQTTVWPIIKGGLDNQNVDWGAGCLGRECHGVRDTNKVPTVELYFTCGDDDVQQRFNYLMARTYIGATGRGQLSEKPLAGGSHHAGGKPFATVQDPDYVALRDWSAADTQFELQTSEGEQFFRNNVQPLLVSRGCYLEACHSLVNFNFYKPLAGTDGFFGTRASLHNYLQARFMLGLETTDPAQGRLLAKNLTATEGGIPHRGGPVLSPDGSCTVDVADVRADPTRRWFDTESAACIVRYWHQLERQIAVESGQLTANPGTVGVFVRRPANSDRLIDFDTYRPGADLLAIDLATDAAGRVTGLAAGPTSLLGSCGINVSNADVRRPDISGDGQRVVFAMRTSVTEGLDLWEVDIDGQNCERLGLAQGVDSTGTPIHHFDPAYSPGGVIIFASTRADDTHPDPARRYASRTPKYFLPNSNIWVFAPGGTPQRLSYLNGAELAPRLLRTREVIYGVEKAAADFYQISTRAIRLDDGGGYLPRLGQRPAMGYGQVTEMRELVDFRAAYISSDPGTYFAGGTLGVHDITLGLEELAFTDVSFFHPTDVIDAGAAARPGVTGTGAYRSPTPLPDGRVLVAYSPGSVDLGNPNASVDYGLWVVDPDGLEQPWQLFDTPGQFDIEPVVAFRRVWLPQPNRVHQGDPLLGEYVFHSIPLFAALLNSNQRTGTEPDDRVTRVRVLEQLPPPDGTASASDVAGQLFGAEQVYVKWRVIGEAPLLGDGSLRITVPAKTPLILQLLDSDGQVVHWQREEEQIGAGETQPRLIQLPLFNAVCGGCHNALDGSELDVTVGTDVTTGASTRSDAARGTAVDLYTDPAERAELPFSP